MTKSFWAAWHEYRQWKVKCRGHINSDWRFLLIAALRTDNASELFAIVQKSEFCIQQHERIGAVRMFTYLLILCKLVELLENVDHARE